MLIYWFEGSSREPSITPSPKGGYLVELGVGPSQPIDFI